MLQLSQISKQFDGVRALHEVSVHVAAGEIFGVIGPNGAGKSTLFDVLSGFCVPDHGSGELAGKALPFGQPARCAQLGLARSFQNLRLFRSLSVLENVMVAADGALPANPLRALWAHAARRQSVDSRERAMIWLEFVGLAHAAPLPAEALSYGDQRRLEIARALASQPRLLALDEPAAGMNTNETRALQTLLERIRTQGITVLLIDHDVGLMMRSCDRLAVLDAGRKIADGTPAEVARDPHVLHAYLGHHRERQVRSA